MRNHLAHWAEIGDSWEAISGFLDHIAQKYDLHLDFDRAKRGTPLEVRKLIDEYLDVNRPLLDKARRDVLDSIRELAGQHG